MMRTCAECYFVATGQTVHRSKAIFSKKRQMGYFNMQNIYPLTHTLNLYNNDIIINTIKRHYKQKSKTKFALKSSRTYLMIFLHFLQKSIYLKYF